MNYPSRVIVALVAAAVLLGGFPGVVGAVGDTSTVISLGPPDDRAVDSPTNVTGEIILGEGRGGATGTIAVTVEHADTAPVGPPIIREVGQKK